MKGPLPACRYHGYPAWQLSGEFLRLTFLAEAGPRLVGVEVLPLSSPLPALGEGPGVRASGAANFLAETPDIHWPIAGGEYFIYGGRRLWHAPEDSPSAYAPDNAGVQMELLEPGAVRLNGPTEPSGLQKSLELRLSAAGPGLELIDRTRNLGSHSLTVAQWAITQLPLGGVATVPLPAPQPRNPGDRPNPNRLFALWPYSDLSDPRLSLSAGAVRFEAWESPPLPALGEGPGVRASPAEEFKLGLFVLPGRISYSLGALRLNIQAWDDAAADNLPYPDLGCNLELFCNRQFLEIETLGPLQTLAPGAEIRHGETWQFEAC